MAWRLDGGRALVTGGTKGIGEATVAELCAVGASVFLCAREGVAARVAAWRAEGLSVAGVDADVSTPEGRALLVEAVTAHWGGELDVFVSNVGTNIRKPTVEYTAEEFERVMGTNFTATYALCQQLKPLLQRAATTSGRTSSIVLNSSVAGVVAISSGSVYAASKAALNQLARNLGCEWGRERIRVNAVCPWYTDTPLVCLAQLLRSSCVRCAASCLWVLQVHRLTRSAGCPSAG